MDMTANTLSETAGPGDGHVRRGAVGLLKVDDSLLKKIGTRHDRMLRLERVRYVLGTNAGDDDIDLSTDQPELNKELAG